MVSGRRRLAEVGADLVRETGCLDRGGSGGQSPKGSSIAAVRHRSRRGGGWVDSSWGAIGAGSPEGNFLFGNGDSFGKLPDLVRRHRGVDGQIGDRTADGAEEMGMLAQVGAVAGGFPVVIDHAYLT